MRELIKSMFSFSWGMSLFGVKQLGNLLMPLAPNQPQNKAATAFNAVAHATEEQLDGVIREAFQAGDRLQKGLVDMMFGVLPTDQTPAAPPMQVSGNLQTQPAPPGSVPGPTQSVTAPVPTTRATAPAPTMRVTAPAPTMRVDSGRLNTTTFITLGEGLAAGMGSFTLFTDTQRESFPAQMARQMQAQFTQPLMQAPGIGNPVGFDHLPVVVPAFLQTTVLDELPPPPVANLAVPGFTLDDALNLRPSQPLVHRHDAKQTAVNLILGLRAMARGEPLLTQLEFALQRRPTFTVVALGYHEALEAAVQGEPGLLPTVGAFRTDYERLLTPLQEAGSALLVLTVPDPFDTAHFATIDSAAKILKVEPAFLLEAYELKPDALLTVNGLMQIGYQIFGGAITSLTPDVVLSAAVANQIRSHIRELNEELVALAPQSEALIYDLHAFFHRVAHEGIMVGTRRLTAEFLGGFYTLNGYYPGATGHALIANELLRLLNNTYGANFPQIDVYAVSLQDPVTSYRQAEGPHWASSELRHPQPMSAWSSPTSSAPIVPQSASAARATARSEASSQTEEAATGLLRLPPGLEQVLPLSKAASYFGDGISALDCQDEQSMQWGSCNNLLFGGLAIVDSHLNGSIRIKFSPPVDNVCDFEVSYEGGFVGEDSVLTTPRFFKMPFQQTRVDAVPGMLSSGKLDLQTGEAAFGEGGVPQLQFYATYTSNALTALAGVNPHFPLLPGTRDKAGPLAFPGQYGSAWVKFEQRPDGLLDFTFYGSTFVPLGSFSKDIRWPLPIAGPTQQYATIPAKGTVMHPHLHLSTKEPEVSVGQEDLLDIPCNTIQELTLHTHNSCFGDRFGLDIPQMGGPGTGRTHLLGRAQIQFGEPSGGSVPVAVLHLNAGGLLAPLPETPISETFPAPLPPGPRGFNAVLRFPLLTYSQNDLSLLDDPFDLALGAVNLKTGRLLNDMLHRGFINLNLIFALLRVEPRTPKSSFFFRGPAWFQKGSNGQLVFRYHSVVLVPYPSGFKYPTPNLTTSFTVRSPSRLDPYLWIRAMQDEETVDYVKEGQEKDVIATSSGEHFSFSYVISGDPSKRPAQFEYVNHTQRGAFRLHSLTWVGFGNSLASQALPGEYDTVTFTGFGVWSKDGVDSIEQASVQISTSHVAPYVGIQIGSGWYVSNVDTKPDNPDDAQP
jgi:hypothetical protein